jgi:hypothetical protein
MKQLARNKIRYWIKALREDCDEAEQALFLSSPNKKLEELVVPFKDSTKNLVGVITEEL